MASFEMIERLSARINKQPLLIAGHPTEYSVNNLIVPAAMAAATYKFEWEDPHIRRSTYYQLALRYNAVGLDFPLEVPPVVSLDCSTIGELDREILGGQKIKFHGILARREVDPGALGLAQYGILILKAIDKAHEPTIKRVLRVVKEQEYRFDIPIEKAACGKGTQDRIEEFRAGVYTILIGTCGLCPCGGTGIPKHLIGISSTLHACKCGSAEGYPERLAVQYGMDLIKIKDLEDGC